MAGRNDQTNTQTMHGTQSTQSGSSSITTLEQAFVRELGDVLSAERQLAKVLPELAKHASHDGLKQALEQHRGETERQAERITQAFQSLERKPTAKTCHGMEGIVREAREMCEMVSDADVRDAVVIAAAQKAEHYEIATYGTLVTWAQRLGHKQVAQLLSDTLAEEKRADERLTELAEQRINSQAKSGR